MAPARAASVEDALLHDLQNAEYVHLFDASGHPLGEAALAADAAAAGRLLDEGVDLLLRQEYEAAVKRLDRLIELFESRLTVLRDHELLHDGMLARAEALSQSAKKHTAKITMQRLAALQPNRKPNRYTHRPRFVALWEEAVSELGATGLIDIRTEPGGAQIFVDGREIGPAPLTTAPLGPGKHYLVVRWPAFVVARAIQLGAGVTMNLDIEPQGPGHRARVALYESIARRRGVAAAAGTIKKLSQIAGVDEVLVAAARSTSGAKYLYLARHDKTGKARTIVRMPVGAKTTSDKALDRLIEAALLNEGDFDIGTDGETAGATELAKALYGARRAEADPADPDGAVDGSPPPPADSPVDHADASQPPPPSTDPSLAAVDTTQPPALTAAATTANAEDEPPSAWWIWTLVAIAAAGAATTSYFVLRPGPQSTMFELELPR